MNNKDYETLVLNLVGSLEELPVKKEASQEDVELGFPSSSSTTKCRTWPAIEETAK